MKKKNIYSTIKDWYRRARFNFHFGSWNWWYYDIKYGVKNLIKWLPVIWNDRDWDYNSWININHHKLKSMEHNIRNNGNHVDCERDADNIRKAMLAFKRLKDDDYLEIAMRSHDAKWGNSDFEFVECEEEHFRGKMYTVETHVENAKTEKEKEVESRERSKWYRHSEYLKKQDLEYATKIINKYLFHWWD